MALIIEEVREWDLKTGTANDSAIKGRRPKIETAKRAAIVKYKSIFGYTVILVLWDIMKFFDSLDLPALIERAKATGFPRAQLQ